MKRWLLLPPLFAVGLFLALHASAGIRDTNASVSVKLNGSGQYELILANIGDTNINSFSFTPAPTLNVASIVSSTKGTCQLSAPGFTCSSLNLAPPPCACTAGDEVTVVFAGSGEIAGSKVQVMGVSITVTGTGAVTTTSQTTTTRPTPPPPPPPPPPAPAAQKLAGSVGPGARITLKKTARAGKSALTVRDLSNKDNFHLQGPGVNKKTGVSFMGTVTWAMMLKKGSYTYRSDAHPSLRGTLRVS